MIFKLFGNKTGVIINRQPEVVDEVLAFYFEHAPHKATAIFQVKDGASYYRELENGACSISPDKLTGEVAVSVTILNGEAAPPLWSCEELKVDRLESGEFLVMPNDMNLPLEFIKLKQENEDIRAVLKRLEDQIFTLQSTLEKIMEGYDFA